VGLCNVHAGERERPSAVCAARDEATRATAARERDLVRVAAPCQTGGAGRARPAVPYAHQPRDEAATTATPHRELKTTFGPGMTGGRVAVTAA